jgi:LacI family transcriptional regulator
VSESRKNSLKIFLAMQSCLMSIGNVTTKKPPVSICKMARQLKLSPSTVSRALRDHPAIARKTVERVGALARELGYEPRKELGHYFRALKKEVNGVAFLVDGTIYEHFCRKDSFFMRIQWAVQQALHAEQIHMLLCCANRDLISNGSLYSVTEGMADGVITKIDDDEIIARLSAHAPVVVLDVESRVEGVDAVTTDVPGTARKQIDYLVARGHRQIACFRPSSSRGVSGPQPWDSIYWQEYIAHSARLGLRVPPAWLEEISFTERNEAQAISSYLDRVLADDRPTAILTYDVYAPPLIEALRERGLSVPEDISLMGYDDDYHDRECPVPLTSVRQNFERMAAEAVRLIRDRIRNPGRASITIRVGCEIIERQSVAAIQPQSNHSSALTPSIH